MPERDNETDVKRAEREAFIPMQAVPAAPAKPKFVLPPGFALYRYLFRRNAPTLGSLRFFQLYTLLATYVLYVCYHLSRKPFSITKTVLHRDNCTDPLPMPLDRHANLTELCSWVPFEETSTYKAVFGWLDFSYWMSYAIVMFFVGGIADRSNLRHFVCAGMVASGFWTVAFGMAYYWQIHALSYFVVIQMICGIVQATGWPVMVALVGNWFGKSKRGLIFGIWNSHSSIGNILGSTIASAFVMRAWALSFIVPGIIIIVGGIVALLFVVVRPEDAGFPAQNVDSAPPPAQNGETKKEEIAMVEKNAAAEPPKEEGAVNFLSAIRIPGVIEFAWCLFFAKAVSYVFLLWLPVYIKDENEKLGGDVAGYLSTIYDVGGITGGIIAGGVSDWIGARGIVAFTLAMLAGPALFVFVNWAPVNMGLLIVLLFIAGICVVGPYALITTAVSADLGSSLKGKSKALATVTGIINGMGSFGSSLGPLAVGILRQHMSWHGVFWVLIGMQMLAALCLVRVCFKEIKEWRQRRAAAH